MTCRACQLHGTNNFAAHRTCFTNVYLSEYVREKVKCHIIESILESSRPTGIPIQLPFLVMC